MSVIISWNISSDFFQSIARKHIIRIITIRCCAIFNYLPSILSILSRSRACGYTHTHTAPISTQTDPDQHLILSHTDTHTSLFSLTTHFPFLTHTHTRTHTFLTNPIASIHFHPHTRSCTRYTAYKSTYTAIARQRADPHLCTLR